MVPLALPVMIGLTAEQLLTGTVLTVGAVAGLSKSLDEFRRDNPRDLGLVDTGLPSLAEMAADLLAGAKLPVAFGPPPNWNPLGDALAAVKGAAHSIWDALNKSLRPSPEVSGEWTFTNNTGRILGASFQAYATSDWPEGEGNYVSLVGKPSALNESHPYINPYESWGYSPLIFEVPPGVSGGSLVHRATGNPNPNGRDDYWAATVAGVTQTIGISGFAPGKFLSYATLYLEDDEIEASENGAIVAKPNTLTPEAFKETENPKPLAPPLPYLPAFAPDIGTPVPEQVPGTPGTPTTPSDPTRKENPKAPPDLLPAKVPIWQPGPNPSTTPGPATVPAPLRNPQAIPSTNPARPNVGFDVGAKPLPQPAPAVKPTPTTDHKVGPITIPAKAPQPTLKGIAEEVGRIEQKLEIVLNPGNQSPDVSWMADLAKLVELLLNATAGGAYELSSPCELNPDGSRVIKEAPFGGGIDRIGVIYNKIDALAQLMQHGKDLKQPACIPPIPRSTVTVTAYEVMES